MTLAPKPPALQLPLLRSLTAGLLLAAAWYAMSPAQAGEGHDHGEAPAAAAGPALPRFTASSELFELVGIINGKQLTLYLDHAASNAPVKNAKLELELGALKLQPQPHGDGEFELTLAQAPAPGVIPVTATITTPGDSDLLAGELDIHDEHAHADEKPGQDWKQHALWGGGGLIALLALGLLTRRRLRAGAAA